MRTSLLAFAILLSVAAPAHAADPTTSLLAALEQCDRQTVAQTGPRLDLLLALADGRSAADMAYLLRDPRPCLGRVTAYGDGADDLVLIGGAGAAADATGAVLWVDRGYWRIASAPLGYWPGTAGPTIRADGKEYVIGVSGGGSGGTIGITAVTIDRGTARTTLRYAFGAELRETRILDDGRLYVEGRVTSDRALTWSTHADWPYGAQWLFERTSGSWRLVAQRQAISPQYLLTGLLGGLRLGDVAMMSRFASDDVVAAARALPALGPGYIDVHGSYATLLADFEITRRETRAWAALPEDVRELPAVGVRTRVISFPTASGPAPVIVSFDRDASGWRITSIASARILAPGAAALVP